MPTEIQHFINGQLTPGRSGRTLPVFNPATGEASGTVPLASVEEVNAAVAAVAITARTCGSGLRGWRARAPVWRVRRAP